VELCILEHEADAPAGVFAEWAAARGHRLDVLRVRELAAWPDPAAFDAIVALGSERSVHASTDPWIAAEVDFLRRAHAARVPVLGLCFGSQALAAALGGEVHAAAEPEIGWFRLAEGGIDPGPWFEWHFDCFTLPPGATVLARDARGGVQAFRVGASVGLQFHPEASEPIIAGWVRGGRAALTRNGLQAEEILRQTAACGDEARRRAYALFDTFAAGWPATRPPSVQS
jgi:GMP synthase-like glutamine amidotransferase